MPAGGSKSISERLSGGPVAMGVHIDMMAGGCKPLANGCADGAAPAGHQGILERGIHWGEPFSEVFAIGRFRTIETRPDSNSLKLWPIEKSYSKAVESPPSRDARTSRSSSISSRRSTCNFTPLALTSIPATGAAPGARHLGPYEWRWLGRHIRSRTHFADCLRSSKDWI